MVGAVRVGKLTLAALSATLDSYLRDCAEEEIPTIAMLAATQEDLSERADSIRNEVGNIASLSIDVEQDMAPVGGGTLPGAELPTAVVSLRHGSLSAEELSQRLRLGSIRVFGRIQQDRVLIDLRSIDPDDDSRVALTIRVVAESNA